MSDVGDLLLSAIQTLSNLVDATLKETPSTNSGYVDASKVVQTGFVRVTGISVIDGGAVGALHDSATIAGVASTNQIYAVPITEGFYPVNMVFPTGLTYVPGAGQKAAFMYTRI